jgi:hypothetical protein
MILRTFYKLYYQHRFKKASLILKIYLLMVIPIKFLINLIYLPKILDLDKSDNKLKLAKIHKLSELFEYFNSDKGNYFEDQYVQPSKRSTVKIKAHGYSIFYEKYFKYLKEKKLNILEIGSFHGNASAALFFYFKNSNLFAGDIYPDLFRYRSNRIKNFFVNSSEEQSIQENIINKFQNNFDIIIEDAGHSLKDQIISLFMLFKKLNQGGLFIIEELDFPEKRKDMNLFNEKPSLKKILIEYKKNKLLLDSKYTKKKDGIYFTNNIESIEIFQGNFNEIAILKKK